MCELLKTRRSVRKYRPEQVPDKLLDAVLEAGLYAPSAMNNQKPVMVAVRDKATRDQLSAMNAAGWSTGIWWTPPRQKRNACGWKPEIRKLTGCS